ncbi:hypothetical protein PROPHIGD27-1_47 [Mycobacterium phage prophiGD27-1]|uniref:hypothetical protein n=1 Tax=Mycobacteroides abscessus TaxID=36809 RepID=UPI0019CF8236|nr:hypothetical protein [Mycobacteroides abscessus]MBN7406849.1 hypothetical protein [Mycobacteroides abscessus subsp. abscessus]QSM04243.1 hypothetical protein PROPHIGD27-1_47 [Mycobacterium phage prophiGD27-1]
MSDEPSDAQKLIAEVLKPLIYADMRYPDELFAQRRAEAYAAEVDKALGGLTQIWSVAGDCNLAPDVDCDHFGDHGLWTCEAEAETREEAEAFPIAKRPDAHIQSRFVSGWTVTE